MKKKTIFITLVILQLFSLNEHYVFADDPIAIPPTENIFIRNGEAVVWQGDFDLPALGTIDIPDKTGTTHNINSNSVLAVLYSLDQVSDAFEISDLEYYSSFNAFYLKCITPKDEAEICDNWQYTVGGMTPFTGMDANILSGGESIGLYFGNPHQVTLDKTSMYAGESFTAIAQKYNYLDNTWAPLTGVTIGVTLPDPSDPWNPIVINEQVVDVDGKASVVLNDINTYIVGIKEDYYFPSYILSVIPNSGGGGGGPTLTTLSIPKATLFLSDKQNTDGSFIDALYTDWVAIAIGSLGSAGDIMKEKISLYMKNNPITSSVVTDNERRAMALMSLGINPYSGTNVDYINKIISSYDGTQFGDNTLFNDDIFALIVLQKAGYISTDTLIIKDIEYVLSHQSPDGSWGSVDMTGAALQALRNFTDIAGVQSSISRGESYLISVQKQDGGFENSSSTSWALQALSSNPSFSSGVARADDYLAKLQQDDGGLETLTSTIENRIWATAYAIPAALHKTWSNILQSFPKPIVSTGGGGTPIILVPEVKPSTQKLVKEEEKADEKNIEGLEVVSKDSLIKPKPKNIQKVVKTKIIARANSVVDTSNVLLASVSSSLEAGTPTRSFFTKIIGTIKSPFIWLWDKLGF
jgi:hypothetical protein